MYQVIFVLCFDRNGYRIFVILYYVPTATRLYQCEVVICDTPAEAIEVVQGDISYWDILITDYDMPDMNGADLAERIRTIAPDLPIILCTALPSIMGGVRAGSKLFDARVPKPIDLKRLVSEIAKATKV